LPTMEGDEMLKKPQRKSGKGYLRPSVGGSDLIEPADPYVTVRDEMLGAVSHKGAPKIAAGYINPTGGYINPTGGDVQPDLGNAHLFYKSLHEHHDDPLYATKKMGKLFGTGWSKFTKQKVGGAVKGGLRVGHVLAPLMKGHLSKALKGSGIDPETAMAYLEQHPMMVKRITPKLLASGGNVFQTIWGWLKKVFTSDQAKQIYKELGSKALDLAATKGKDYLLEYVDKRMGGSEPGPKAKGGYATHGGADEAPVATPVVSIPIPTPTPAEAEIQRKPTAEEVKEAKEYVTAYVDKHGPILAGGSKKGWYAFWHGFKKGFSEVWKFLIPIVKPLLMAALGTRQGGVQSLGMRQPRRIGGPDSLPPWVKEGISPEAWHEKHKPIGGVSDKKKRQVRGGSVGYDL